MRSKSVWVCLIQFQLEKLFVVVIYCFTNFGMVIGLNCKL